MAKKTLLISPVLFSFLLSEVAGKCFAGTSELLEQAQIYKQDGNYEQATEWNSYPPPNYKVIHHYTGNWENH